MALSFKYCTKDDVKKHLLGLDVSDLPTSLEDAIDQRYIPWAQRDADSYCGSNFDLTVTEEFYDGSGTSQQILLHRPVREIVNAVLYIIPSVQWVQFKRWFYVSTKNQLGIQVARRGGVEPKDETVAPPYVFSTGLGFQSEDPDSADQTASFSDTQEQYGRSDLFIDASMGRLTIPPRILFLENQAVPFWNYTFLRGYQNLQVSYVYGYSDPTQADPLTGSTLGNLPAEITDATAMWAARYVLTDKAITVGAGSKSISIESVNRNFGEMPYEGIIKLLDERAKSILNRYKVIGV